MQLSFYTSEYLAERPVLKNTSYVLMLKPEKEFGINGFKSRLCLIKPVEKDFKGSIDVELFAMFMGIPEEIITVES